MSGKPMFGKVLCLMRFALSDAHSTRISGTGGIGNMQMKFVSKYYVSKDWAKELTSAVLLSSSSACMAEAIFLFSVPGVAG